MTLDESASLSPEQLRVAVAEWTDHDSIQAPDGIWYAVQREQTLGAQNGGLIYYAMKRGPKDQEWKNIPDTTRTRKDAVKRLIQRIIKTSNAAALSSQ